MNNRINHLEESIKQMTKTAEAMTEAGFLRGAAEYRNKIAKTEDKLQDAYKNANIAEWEKDRLAHLADLMKNANNN